MDMHLPRNWGASEAEMRTPRPCDGLVGPDPGLLFRAVDVAAPRELVFRWLCQMRAAPYSYDLIDNGGRQSPRALVPGLEKLEPGLTVMRIFELVSFETNRHLTLRIQERKARDLFGDFACTYALEDAPNGITRLIVKIVVDHTAQPTLVGRAMRHFLPWGDLVMMRKQLLNLKELAERDARQAQEAA
jgi:hypothetical protein